MHEKRHCCCCVPLPDGVMLVGIYGAAFHSGLLLIQLTHGASLAPDPHLLHPPIAAEIVRPLLLFSHLLGILVNCLLVLGMYLGKRRLMFPWLLVQGLLAALLASLAMYYLLLFPIKTSCVKYKITIPRHAVQNARPSISNQNFEEEQIVENGSCSVLLWYGVVMILSLLILIYYIYVVQDFLAQLKIEKKREQAHMVMNIALKKEEDEAAIKMGGVADIGHQRHHHQQQQPTAPPKRDQEENFMEILQSDYIVVDQQQLSHQDLQLVMQQQHYYQNQPIQQQHHSQLQHKDDSLPPEEQRRLEELQKQQLANLNKHIVEQQLAEQVSREQEHIRLQIELQQQQQHLLQQQEQQHDYQNHGIIPQPKRHLKHRMQQRQQLQQQAEEQQFQLQQHQVLQQQQDEQNQRLQQQQLEQGIQQLQPQQHYYYQQQQQQQDTSISSGEAKILKVKSVE